MRIYVIEPRGAGGMIHYAYQLCTALSGHGAEVTLVTAKDYELEQLPHNFKVNKFLSLWQLSDRRLTKPPRNNYEGMARKIFWQTRRGLRAIRLVMQWVRLNHYLLRERPDIVQFGEIEFPFEGIFLQHLKRRGLVLSQICHEFESRESSSLLAKIKDQLNNGIYQSFSILFLHGESNRQRFLSCYAVPQERLHLIVHGNEQIFPASPDLEKGAEELRQRYGIETHNPVVLFFGTLTPSKGVPDLIRAFASVYKQNPQTRLVIAGAPTKFIDMPSLLKLVSDLGLGEVTTFDSRYLPMEEVGPLMHLARVVVLPYINSTQSGAIQVAYAFARPVVATNVGAFPDVVDEGKSGFLVPPESPEALADAISNIINDMDKAHEMGKYAKQLSETRFAWQPIAGSIMQTYQAQLNSAKADSMS
jgi:glycosyltransferase involved in cell wall biosynthesis